MRVIVSTQGSGIPLVLIHGFGVDHRILLPLKSELEDSGWQRLFIGLPWTEAARAAGAPLPDSPRALADAVQQELIAAIGDRPFAVLGQSFGAMVARSLAHALRDQCLGLATVAGVFEMDHGKRMLPPRQVITHDPAVLAAAGDARAEFEEFAVAQTAEGLDGFLRFVVPGLRGADQPSLDRLSASYTDAYAPERETPEPFPAPSLHIFGRQDHVVGFEDGWATRAHYPRGTFTVLDAAGHNVHLEQPRIVAALIGDWLERMRSHWSAQSDRG